MDFSIKYQICKFPQNNNKSRYLVRKIITDKDNKIIKYENYNYVQKNLNKLNKEIQNMKYEFEIIHSNSFNNIPLI